MADGSKQYMQALYNKSGYVTLSPNVAAGVDLLEGVPINPYSQSATQEYPLGTRAIRGCEEWLYCKSDSTGFSTIGTPIQSPAAIHAEADDDIVLGQAAAIGDYEVIVDSTANLDTGVFATKNGLAEGFLIVNDGTGQGQMYKIKGNTVFATTAEATITLYDPLTVALVAGTSEIGIIENPFHNVLATTAVVSGMFIGVNQIAVTASYYFWAKVRGPAPVVAHTAIAKGSYVVVGTTAAKADPAAAFTTELIIGEALTPAVADTEQFITYLYGR